MINRIQTQSVAVRFDHLLKIIGSDSFLQREGIGNEVPFFIAPFKVAESVEMERSVGQLVTKLSQKGIQVLHLNLYDVVHQMLDNATGDWDWCLENEEKFPKKRFLEHLRGVAGSEKVVDSISQKMDDTVFDVLFLSGIGEVFPFLRSHNILHSLQKRAKTHPTVMFFPGEYTHSLEKGASLDLFGLLQDDKYYRAFNIYDREI